MENQQQQPQELQERQQSKCPVNYGQAASGSADDSSSTSVGWWLRRQERPPPTTSGGTAAPTVVDTNQNSASTTAVDVSVPASIEEAQKYSQVPHANQNLRLGTTRQVSSIPRGRHRHDESSNDAAAEAVPLPHHQAGTNNATDDIDSRWVYPSEQQLLNAMRRKGYSTVPEDSIPIVLQIHNTVNESTWKHVLEYHQHYMLEPRLVKFQGRPNDWTPKAYVWNLLGYPTPFDRHDWHVAYYQQSPLMGGRWIEQRYVIDFYEANDSQGSSSSSASTAIVDVRPALDSPRALWLHAKRFLQLSFPGITNYWYRSVMSTNKATSTAAATDRRNSSEPK